MANNHIITKEIGNLRGFSTDSIYLRPPNVADIAINLQRAPDGTTQLRRGYQCQIAQIGGMGIGTFDDPALDEIQTVCIGTNGFLYNKLTKQIFFYYDGQVTGVITGISNANPANVLSVDHDLESGTFVIIRDVVGMTQVNNKTYIIDVTGVDNFDIYSTVDSKFITNALQTNPCKINSPAHGLSTGKKIMIAGVHGMVELNNLPYTITVIDPDNFTLDGIDATSFTAYSSGGKWYGSVDSTAFSPYSSGGYWSVSFADQRYLTMTIFTDPRFLSTNPGWSIAPWSFSPWGAPSGESITCNLTVNRAAQIYGDQTNTNTIVVQFGHELVAGDVIQFYASNGVFNQRNVLSTTTSTITFDGYPVSVLDGVYVSQFFDIPFRKGFDVSSPYLISTFIATITTPPTNVHGLQVAINGDSDLPAAFLQIFEPIIIDSNSEFTIDYWYWEQVNSPETDPPSPPFPGSANVRYQNSPDFENASMAVFDDVIYIANGWDYPQKYDGQTVYRAGMPLGGRPQTATNTTFISKPFQQNDVYQYATTYEQIDNRGHIVEGEISEVWIYTVGTNDSATDVTVVNLTATTANNWNTNSAIASGGASTSYGPDIGGFYYDLTDVDTGYTLKIGDSAYYADLTCAVITATATDVVTLTVTAGHNVIPGDLVYFIDANDLEIQRQVLETSTDTITIVGEPVDVDPSDADHANVLVYKTSLVFGDVAIIDQNQSDVNTIDVITGHTILSGDLVNFIDADNNLQRRNVVSVGATTVEIDGIPVNVSNKFLIASENKRTDAINLRRSAANAATLATDGVISNNLRINIYRTKANESFGVNGKIYLVASIPNDGVSGNATQIYIDGIPDIELARPYDDPIELPTPPPISKYLKAFGNQLFYAGGERGNAENSDRVFFSNGNAPEVVPLAVNFFNVPNVDDDITGIGVSGSTLITTKNHSLWAATGNFLSGNIDVVQIAPGTNIGCVANASIASIGTLMYFLHTNGVYAITENQLFPTDAFGNPIPITLPIDVIFRETRFLPQTRYVLKRAVGVNYTKDNQYLLFLPCEDSQSSIRTANANSTVLCYDYQEKNWYSWFNINAAGGMFVIDDDLYFQERRFSGVDGNTANLYKQHRFYRLIDHADHAGPERAEWRSSWTDLGQPEVRKKFCRCVLLMDRLSDLQQFNDPVMYFSSYLNRLPNLQSTMAKINQVDNIRNSSWSYSGWGWNYWSGYQDSFITVNLKGGTVAKSIQVGFTLQGINMDIKLAGFQLEAIPENRNTVVR